MKHLPVILLLFLALSSAILPCKRVAMSVLASMEQQAGATCTSAKPCCMAKMQKSHTAEADSQPGTCHSSSEEDHSQCSSLCQCGCCGYLAMLQFIDYPQPRLTLTEAAQPIYTEAYHFEYALHIWHPPRLS